MRGFVIVLLCTAAGAWAQPALPGDEARDRPLEELLADLDHPLAEIRSRAAAAIAASEDLSEDALAGLYLRQDNHERRMRLREAIERLFYRRLMKGEEGFMGIQLQGVADILDPTTGRRVEAVLVVGVIRGQPAEAAGILPGDILIGLDGKPTSWFFSTPVAGAEPRPAAPGAGRGPAIVLDPRIERFTQHIKRRTPGSPVSLTLLRCDGRTRTLELTVADEPAQTLQGAAWATVPGLMLGLSPQATARAGGGLIVTRVAEDSPAAKAGLQAGDVLLTVIQPPPDGSPAALGPVSPEKIRLAVTPETPPEWPARLAQQWRPGSTIALELTRVEQLRIEMNLGRRPVQLMNASDRAEARARFLMWWRQQCPDDTPPRRSAPPSPFVVMPQRPPDNLPEAQALP